MKESLEPKLSSVPTEDLDDDIEGEKERSPLPEVVINPMAPPYQLVCWFYYDDLKAKFDEFWGKHGDQFSKMVKSKKGRGGRLRNVREIVEKRLGIKKIYAEVLITSIHEQIKDEIMFIEGFELFDFEPGKQPHLVSVVYFTPKLKLKKEINFACLYPFIKTEEQEREYRFRELQSDSKIHRLIPEGEDQIKESYDLNLTILASVDGEPYTNGTIRDQWVEWREIAVPELKEALLAHKRGDVFDLEFAAVHDQQVLGKKVHAEVTVHEMKLVEYPEVSDDLVKKAGFDSLGKFEEKFKEDYKRYKINAEHATATDHIINQIVRNSTIPPVPNEWLRRNVERLVDLHIKRFGGDKKKAMLAVGATDDESLHHKFRGEIYRDYMHRLALIWYGNEYGVEPGGEEFITDVMERIRWIEDVDKTNVEEVGGSSDQEV